ncbi:MAG: TonB-system energizer ExbB [Halothiobacillaceae bacterium]|nr:MAG: TonB-system energizer ExbB [Halothiobacillaceae bacterium]
MDFLKHYLDFFVFGILGLMSFLLVWLVVERYLTLARLRVEDFALEESLNVAMTRNLTTISSIGANAPYVGLLGTVLGILITFYDLSQGGNIDPKTIMLGLALALKATAAGLVVAIPAILFFNALVRRTEVLNARWKEHRAGLQG